MSSFWLSRSWRTGINASRYGSGYPIWLKIEGQERLEKKKGINKRGSELSSNSVPLFFSICALKKRMRTNCLAEKGIMERILTADADILDLALCLLFIMSSWREEEGSLVK